MRSRRPMAHMKGSYMRYWSGCNGWVLGLLLVGSGAAAQSSPAGPSGEISTTLNNQIVLELRPGDTADPNPVDLEGLTLVFQPGGAGGYSRSVQPLAWEDELGEAVADEAMVEFESFIFDFAGQRWGAVYVSRHGLLTFGAPFAWSYFREGRFFTMHEIAADFVRGPTISPLYAPAFGDWAFDDPESSRFVAHWPNRMVVTWVVRDTQSYVRGVHTRPNRFQAVLHADGKVQFNYADITSGDGIAGLFSNAARKGDLIASVVDGTNPDLPGHLDLLDVAVYESNTDRVIVEFTMRGPIPDPEDGAAYTYRLYFDTDEPYWTEYDFEDEDFALAINVNSDGELTTWSGTVLESEAANRLALSADIGPVRGRPATLIALAEEYSDDSSVSEWSAPVRTVLPTARRVDLSTAARAFSVQQHEVFHNRGLPDLEQLACRVIDTQGDKFDFMVFNNEFEVDSQEAGSGVWTYLEIPGTGAGFARELPCGPGRLKALLVRPISMHTFGDGDIEHIMGTVAHEFGHVWSARLSYITGGRRESLVDLDDRCRCHWHFGLHTPAAFPPRGRQDAGSHMSNAVPGRADGAGFWYENADGTFTPGRIHPERSGPSWLDLYVMGLADAREVPDTFILRNLGPLNDGSGAYRADKETITIEQVVAAEGPRVPSAFNSQKVFNAGFVYLVEREQKPAADFLELHARFIGEMRERWFRFTGERSRITSSVSSQGNGPPMVVGALPDLTLRAGSTADVDASAAFRDPDGDPLTYDATSSAPTVASVAAAGSTLSVEAVAAGTATVSVAATDIGGSNRVAMLAFGVTVRVAGSRVFTDDPIVPGVTPVRAIHFTELRSRIDALRAGHGLGRFGWTDPVLRLGVTPVRGVHLLELRAALAEAYAEAGQAVPRWTNVSPGLRWTPIRAAHVTELRAAVLALE